MLPWTPHNAFSPNSPAPPSSIPPSNSNSMYNNTTASTSGSGSADRPTSGPHPEGLEQVASQPPSLLSLPSPPGPLALPPPAPMTLATTLHFLQTEHRRYARDRNEWEIERAEMRARIALLEGEKRGNEGALRDLARRCRMLEGALRSERSKFMTNNPSLTSQSTSPSGTSSPLLLPPRSHSPPLASSSHSAPTSTVGVQEGAASEAALTASSDLTLDMPSTSTTARSGDESTKLSNMTRKEMSGATNIGGGAIGNAASVHFASSSNDSSLSHGGATGSNGSVLSGSIGMGVGGSSRDPRGKARSRDYLKRCLQEITYLTASTTLNPLSTASYALPSVARPRKLLQPIQPPPTTAPSDDITSTSMKPETKVIVTGHQKSHLPSGMYSLKGTRVPSASSSHDDSITNNVLSTAAPSSPQRLPPAGDPASIYVPLQRAHSNPTSKRRTSSSERSTLDNDESDILNVGGNEITSEVGGTTKALAQLDSDSISSSPSYSVASPTLPTSYDHSFDDPDTHLNVVEGEQREGGVVWEDEHGNLSNSQNPSLGLSGGGPE